MSIAKRFSLPVAAAIAALVLSAPTFAVEHEEFTVTMHVDESSSGEVGGGYDVLLALYSIVASIL